MEIFKTLIREDCKLGRLEHTEGFISGIQFALCRKHLYHTFG